MMTIPFKQIFAVFDILSVTSRIYFFFLLEMFSLWKKLLPFFL